MNEHELADPVILHDIDIRPAGAFRDELRAVAERAQSRRIALPNRDGDLGSRTSTSSRFDSKRAIRWES